MAGIFLNIPSFSAGNSGMLARIIPDSPVLNTSVTQRRKDAKKARYGKEEFARCILFFTSSSVFFFLPLRLCAFA
jgi:hypothetical protein